MEQVGCPFGSQGLEEAASILAGGDGYDPAPRYHSKFEISVVRGLDEGQCDSGSEVSAERPGAWRISTRHWGLPLPV